ADPAASINPKQAPAPASHKLSHKKEYPGRAGPNRPGLCRAVWGQGAGGPARHNRERHGLDISSGLLRFVAGAKITKIVGFKPASRHPGDQRPTTDTLTGASPLKPSWFAAAGVRSMMRPRVNGPRSLMRTTTLRPLRRLVTRTLLPNGSDGCAAVSPDG